MSISRWCASWTVLSMAGLVLLSDSDRGSEGACPYYYECTEFQAVAINNARAGRPPVWRGRKYYERNSDLTMGFPVTNACARTHASCDEYARHRLPTYQMETIFAVDFTTANPDCEPATPGAGDNVEWSVGSSHTGGGAPQDFGRAYCTMGM